MPLGRERPARRISLRNCLPFFPSGFSPAFPAALVVPSFGLSITRAAVVTNAAAGAVTAIFPGAGLDRPAMHTTQPLSGRRNFEAEFAAFVAIPRPPAAAQDRTPVAPAQAFFFWRNLCGSIAFRAARVAMARAPITRPDRTAVHLAQPRLNLTAALLYGSLSCHDVSILQLGVQKTVIRCGRLLLVLP